MISRASVQAGPNASNQAQSSDSSRVSRHYQPLIEELLRARGFAPDAFLTEIGSADEMFWKAILPGYRNNQGLALWKYVESCLRMEAVYGQIVRDVHEGYDKVERLLDFGSGYGRLTRALVNRVSPTQVWVSDIYPHAIAWQAEQMGVNAVVSVKDPAAFALPLEFSVVFAGSVFSHLPDGLFQRWLERLYRCVSERGVLVFSVHDGALLPAGEVLDETGYRYLNFSESDILGTDVYGMTYVSEDFVRRRIAELFPQRSLDVVRVPKGLYENQDLYVVAGPGASLSGLKIAVTPLGGFDSIRFDPQVGLVCDGWAVDFNTGGNIESIRGKVDDRPWIAGEVVGLNSAAARFFPGSSNEPIRWRLTVPVDFVGQGRLLRVAIGSSSGESANAMLSLIDGVDRRTDFGERAT